LKVSETEAGTREPNRAAPDLIPTQQLPRFARDALVKLGESQWGIGKGQDTVKLVQAGIQKGVSDKDNAEIRLGMGYLPQESSVFRKLTVEENLLLGAFRSLARAEIAGNRDMSYETFPVLRERRRQLAGSLSGGAQVGNQVQWTLSSAAQGTVLQFCFNAQVVAPWR